MTPCRHFAPGPFREGRTHFQLPQAILANRGNWLIPKRKAFRAIRCSKAGDGSAYRTRAICPGPTLHSRDGGFAKVYLYAIGIARVCATSIAFRLKGAPITRKPYFRCKTHTHPITPRQYSMHQNSSCRFSFSESGAKGTSTSRVHPFSNPKYDRVLRSQFA